MSSEWNQSNDYLWWPKFYGMQVLLNGYGFILLSLELLLKFIQLLLILGDPSLISPFVWAAWLSNSDKSTCGIIGNTGWSGLVLAKDLTHFERPPNCSEINFFKSSNMETKLRCDYVAHWGSHHENSCSFRPMLSTNIGADRNWR